MACNAAASSGRIGRRCTVPPSATTTSADQCAGGDAVAGRDAVTPPTLGTRKQSRDHARLRARSRDDVVVRASVLAAAGQQVTDAVEQAGTGAEQRVERRVVRCAGVRVGRHDLLERLDGAGELVELLLAHLLAEAREGVGLLFLHMLG